MIAMATIGEPALIIADEPTTALDVTVQRQILQLLDDVRRQDNLALMFISHDIGVIARCELPRMELRRRLEAAFPRMLAMEFGSERPAEVAILTGGGYSVGGELAAAGVDTLVTGELKEHFFNRAQEERLNLYACGHYATEVFGVCALAEELAARFGLPWEFIATQNPL